MAANYTILFSGLGSSEQKYALKHFANSGHTLVTAADIHETQEKLSAARIDLAYLRSDKGRNATAALESLGGLYPALPLVLVCDRMSGSLILDAWHAGAADIVLLPLTAQSLDASLQRACRKIPPHAPEPEPSAAARFFYIDESGKDCWTGIQPPRFTLGRGAGNHLIVSHMGVSRSHAEVLIRNGEYLLRDLGSKLGTFVNGVRVDQARLADGDRVQLGGAQGVNLTFHAGDLLQSLIGRTDIGSDSGMSLRGFKEMGRLLATFRALSSISILDDLLALIVDTAVELTEAERGFIMLRETDGDLSFRCARNRHRQPLEQACFQTSHRVPYEVVASGRPVVIKDLEYGDSAECHNLTRQLGLRSISCVPLRYLTMHESDCITSSPGAKILGVLYVDSASAASKLSRPRIDALETLASEAAIAVYNARLYKDSQDKHRMDEQLKIACDIQQALHPNPNRDLRYVRACSRTIPCYDIGGDYFDYFDLSDERFGFVLGDVAGKGLSAALLAALTQGIFSVAAGLDEPLPILFSKVNRNLAQRGTESRFVTLFLGILDRDGTCIYVNAGHNPPLLLKPSGAMQELTVGGMVLGLFADAQYESGTLQLQPGDHIILFTDGVVEALNAQNKEFGMEQLTSLLQNCAQSSASEILDQIQDAVLSFAAAAPQHDDITIMVLEFTGMA